MQKEGDSSEDERITSEKLSCINSLKWESLMKNMQLLEGINWLTLAGNQEIKGNFFKEDYFNIIY